jgi:hypothetical protein
VPADAGHDGIVCFFVYAEWFFSHEMLAGFDSGTVKFPMQIVRDRDINRFYVTIIQKLAIVIGNLLDSWYIALEPIVLLRGQILMADCDYFGAYAYIGQVKPAGGGAGEFTPHHTAAD